MEAKKRSSCERAFLTFRLGFDKTAFPGFKFRDYPSSPKLKTEGCFRMLRWTLIFLVIAVIAAVLGFGGIAGAAASIAKICFIIFVVFFLISLIYGLMHRSP